MRKVHCSPWFALAVALVVAARAHAEPLQIEVPESVSAPIVVKLDGNATQLQLVFQRPATRLCFAIHGGEPRVWYQGPGGKQREAKIVANRPCLVDPPLETVVTVERVAAGQTPLEVAFYDPEVAFDPLAWSIVDARHVKTAYPLLFRPLAGENNAPLRERVFVSAPRSTFRFVAFDLRPSDLQWLGSSPKIKQLPSKGEPVLALKPGVVGTTDICTLDGMCPRLRDELLTDRPPGVRSAPALGRWTTTEQEMDANAGVLEISVAHELAARGNAPAADYVRASESHDACVTATWKKIDPSYDAKRFALVSKDGTTVALDQVVEKRVRAACHTADFEKRRAALAAKVRAARGKDFERALAELEQRLPADPAQWPAVTAAPAAPAASSKAGVGVGLQLMKGRVWINAVLAGGAAERAGVRKGDYLIAVDGKPAGTVLEPVRDALQGAAGTDVTLTLERNGQPVETKIRRAPLP